MLKEQLLKEIAYSEARIRETEQSQVFAEDYKQREIAIQKAAIAQKKIEIAEYDKIVDQSKLWA